MEEKIKQSVGIMLGSFDPPHLGHIETAKRAKEIWGLQQVHMIPIPQSPTKALRRRTATLYAQKIDMCHIIADTNRDWLFVSGCAKNFSAHPVHCLQDNKTFGGKFF